MIRATASLSCVAALAMGCGDPADVSVYVALDEEHSSRLVARCEADLGLVVKARHDTEASKTVGLVSALLEERAHPRCDVFWNNELAQTVRLAQKGLLARYDSPAAATVPEQFRDPERRWTGFAARARILIVNRELVPDGEQRPTSMWDLIDPKWKGKCGVARPLTGTTLTHFAALGQVLGDAEFGRFLRGLEENDVQMLQSNGATMRAVAAGDLVFAFTDTDDFHVALTKGHPVDAVFPDQGAGQVGTMLIPNSIAIIEGGPHPEGARRFVDWVLSTSTEALLAAAKSAQIPVRAEVAGPPAEQVLSIGEFRAMEWDAERTAARLEETARAMAQRF